MKKLLLSLVTVLSFTGAFAYEIGEYIFTPDAKFKVISENQVPALSAWNGASDADVWSPEEIDGYTALVSQSGAEGATLLTFSSGPLSFGSSYVITLKIKGVADTPSSTTAAAQNEINAFVTNGEPSVDGVVVGTANADYFMVANSQTILSGEWTEISFAFVDTCTEATIGSDAHYINLTIGRLTTGTAIAEAELREVSPVYDTRIMDRKVAFANAVLNDANFSAGADATEVLEVIETYGAMVEAGAADDQAEMEGLAAMLDEALNAYMDVNSSDLSANFANIGITGISKYNRGSISNGQQINGFIFRGDNWLHAEGANVLNKQIQGTYSNGAGSVALYNTNIPAGKFFISGELMNALCDKNYAYTYTLEKGIKLFVGSDSTELQTIKGREFEQFYFIGEIKDGETFEAGFWWEGHDAGSAFQVRNVQVRGFGDIEAQIARKEIWNKFKTQWDAAVNARKSMVEKQGNADYPWEQDSIAKSLANWDPFYNQVINDGWVVYDGEEAKDAGVATNEQLETWTLYQGFDPSPYDTTDEEQAAIVKAHEYQVVRGYQNANNYVQAQNQIFIDLKAKVAEAEAAVVDPEYSFLDSDALVATIAETKQLIAGVSAVNEGETFQTQFNTLNEVLQEFYDGGASYARPASITIINPDFTYSSQNITGGTATKDASGGWDSYTTNTSEYWRVGADANFSTGARAAMWRGWTGNPLGSLTQDVVVTKAGHYTFKCEAYCTVDGGGQSRAAEILNNNVRHIVTDGYYDLVWDEELEEEVEEWVETSRDTIYISGIYLVFGSVTEQKMDSLDIWTSGESGANAVWTPQAFELHYDKVSEGEETLRFGMDGLRPKEELGYTYKPNAYGFGAVQVLYSGPSEKYYEDKAAGVDAPIATVNKSAKPVAIFTLSGAPVNTYVKGINIVKYDDGSVRKIYKK